MEWGEGVYRVLVGKSEGKRPLGRPRRRWVDNIMMDLQEVGCGYMDWIGLAQDRNRWRTLVSAVMNLRVPWNAGNFLTSCKPVSFSRRTQHHWVIYIYIYISLSIKNLHTNYFEIWTLYLCIIYFELYTVSRFHQLQCRMRFLNDYVFRLSISS